ncbi:hypothetical protein WN48_04388 [Eufriesea mexicana]|nr:hypothetical protein WN48_04388 [Eufriesea mexicana]
MSLNYFPMRNARKLSIRSGAREMEIYAIAASDERDFESPVKSKDKKLVAGFSRFNYPQ